MSSTDPNRPPAFPQPQSPPVYFPGPMFYPPPPSQRGGFARAIFTTLAVTIFGFSITLNIYLLIAQIFSGDAGYTIQSHTITAGNATKQVAVVPVAGLIMGEAADDLDRVLTHLETTSGIVALVVEIDSPGGEVSASDQMYSRLMDYKAKTGVPIVISMQSVAASGGYYIACAGDHIVAQRATTTGSVGVYWGGLNFSEMMEKYGVEDTTIVSTGSTLKLAGSPTRPLSKDQREYMQNRVDADLVLFKSVIVQGRKLTQQAVDQIATGATFSGEEAKKLQLVDDVGYLSDAVAFAEKKAGVSGSQVVRYSPQKSFWESLSKSQDQQSNLIETKIGQTSIKIDKKVAAGWLSSKPMFLYRGY